MMVVHGAFKAERDLTQTSFRSFSRLIIDRVSQPACASGTTVGHCSIMWSSILNTPKILEHNGTKEKVKQTINTTAYNSF